MIHYELRHFYINFVSETEDYNYSFMLIRSDGMLTQNVNLINQCLKNLFME